MFSENKKNNSKSKSKSFSREQNKIAKGTTVVGDIDSQGSFRIEGVLKGSLKTPGKVVVSETGVIEGDIECSDADFEGTFTGNLKVKNNLTLKATTTIDGDVVTGKLAVEPGANLNGTCTMKGKGSLKNINSQNEQGKAKSKQEISKNA